MVIPYYSHKKNKEDDAKANDTFPYTKKDKKEHDKRN